MTVEGQEFDILAGPIYHALRESKADLIILQGGTDSGKTYSTIQEYFTIASTSYPPASDPIISILSESIPNSKKGAYRVAKAVYDSTPFFQRAVKEWKDGERIVYFKTGWVMEFLGATDEQNAKQGKRQHLFVNEAQGVAWPIFWQYAKRTRIRTVIDYNPSAPFWAHEKLIGTTKETNDLNANVQLIISDHRHNPFLSDREHEKTENIKDKELWWVYARGRTGNLTGLIYPDWKMIPDSDYPWDADNKFGGIDFGYTNDPTAAVRVSRIANKLFIHELCYQPAMTPTQIHQLFKGVGFMEQEPIYCEHDGDMIRQMRQLEMFAIAARKGPNSIKPGIMKVKEYEVFYTSSSKNLKMEREKYMWMIDPDTNKATNTPVDKDNHCFVGETRIATPTGQKRLFDIVVGDLVSTLDGPKEVLMKWDNGLQQVNKYRLQFDMFSLNLVCTPDHRIKTNQGWIPIKNLTSSHDLYLLSHLMERNTDFTQVNGISQEDVSGCMLSYGRQQMGARLRKDFISTTLTEIPGITDRIIYNSRRPSHINQIISESVSKTIKHGLQNSMKEVLNQQKHGIVPMMGENGIVFMVKNHGKKESIQSRFANIVAKNIKQDTPGHPSSVIITARLKHLGIEGSWQEQVFDLTVDQAHHYIAEGIVVHNCMDAIRYAVYSHFYRQE